MNSAPTKINSHIKPNRLGKGKFSDQVITKDFPDSFTEIYPEYNKDTIINEWLNLTDILDDIICTDPAGFNLSLEVGDFSVGFIKRKNIILDLKSTSEEGKAIKYLNLATNRKSAKILWKAPYTKNPDNYLKYLAFTSTRKRKNKLVKALGSNGNIFLDVNTFKKNNKF